MAGGLSERSTFIDVTYQYIYDVLSGQLDHCSPSDAEKYLSAREDRFKNPFEPFGKPSSASRTKVGSGSVTLQDGVVVKLEDAEKEFTFAISTALEIDEIQALVLFRAYIYDRGLPEDIGRKPDSSLVTEVLDAVTPFYFSERLALLRTFIPLLRTREEPENAFCSVATAFLARAITNPATFASSLVDEYIARTRQKPPAAMIGDRQKTAVWQKQCSKEQLTLLEVLFWTMWSSSPCSGSIVERIFTAAYDTDFGRKQRNSTLLLDEEGVQIQHDISALWSLVTIEVLELETIAATESIEISASPVNQDFYTSSPDMLLKIHKLVASRPSDEYACTHLAWTFVIDRVATSAQQLKQIPDSYRALLDVILSSREMAAQSMKYAALNPENGLFGALLTLLTNTPLFVTSVSLRTDSAISSSNTVAFRSILKGLIIALAELLPVEHVPEYESLVEVWVALFGRSERSAISGICNQFWSQDSINPLRRGLLDVARTRFPVQIKPFVRLTRALTAAGILDTDEQSAGGHQGNMPNTLETTLCAEQVFNMIDHLPTYTQLVPLGSTTGSHAIYERTQERLGSSVMGIVYSNVRPISLPGGTVLPPGSRGSLLSGDGGENVVVAWKHEHSGWRLLLDVLRSYAASRTSSLTSRSASQSQSIVALSLASAGVEADGAIDEALVTDILDLVRAMLHENSPLPEVFLQTLDEEKGISTSAVPPPDLVQVTITILEEALARRGRLDQHNIPSGLVTSALSVLSGVLSQPVDAPRVWLYIRSTPALFGSDRPEFSSAALAAERITGKYTMTLALLQLVQKLFTEAFKLKDPGQQEQLHGFQNDVLMRALRFVHSEIWVEHLNWKYARLADRFEIGRRVAMLYSDILQHTPSNVESGPFAMLSRTLLDLLLLQASASSINPIIGTIGTSRQMLKVLYTSRRMSDSRSLIMLLHSQLRLLRLLLNWKYTSNPVSPPTLLEQILCTHAKNVHPIDSLAALISQQDVGPDVPIEAGKVLSSLSACLSSSEPTPMTLVGHFINPENIVATLVKIARDEYSSHDLRLSIWRFMALTMDKEPALASLYVSGTYREVADIKGKGKQRDPADGLTALAAAQEIVSGWETLLEVRPELLSSVLLFLAAVWRHGTEHKLVLQDIRENVEFWAHVTSIIGAEQGPPPEFQAREHILIEETRHSDVHEAIADHCYRTTAKSSALHIVALDIGIHTQSESAGKAPTKPHSLKSLEPKLRSPEDISELLAEATPNSYLPQLYDELSDLFKDNYSGLTVLELETLAPQQDREYGDDFTFSTETLRGRLNGFSDVESLLVAERQLCTINMNLSLMHSQRALTSAWQHFLRIIGPHYRGDRSLRTTMLSIASSLSFDVSREARGGDMASSIHSGRLSLLVAILELVWFSPLEDNKEIKTFVDISENMRGIILNEYQPPAQSILYTLPEPFHRPLLQSLYFCVRLARTVVKNTKAVTAEWRLKLSFMNETATYFVIEALKVMFVAARSRADLDLDHDLELLVSVFEQCTRPDISSASSLWLAKCQETDVLQASFDLFTALDLTGLSHLHMSANQKQPLYVPHILVFHMCLASIPAAAERFATEGVLAAYINNSLTPIISGGRVDVMIPELPAERSPAHRTYCSMLSIVSASVRAMGGRHNHYFDAEACGLVQLYSDQISRALSWTTSEPITTPFIEELEQVVHLFYSIANNCPPAPNANPAVESVLQIFSSFALKLLQQINYAVTHPNLLGSLLDPVTVEERAVLEKESSISDVLKRPMVAHLLHRLYRLSGNVLETLICISRADEVLFGDEPEWPVNQAIVIPNGKVVFGEAASIGTLIELGNSTLDMMRELVGKPAGQSLIAPAGTQPKTTSPELDIREGVITTRRNLECLLVYSITQLAMWLSKPEDSGEVGADVIDMSMDEDSQRRTIDMVVSSGPGRKSVSTFADRLKSGMTGEMASDLHSLLNKAKPIVAKSNDLIGTGGQVDLTDVLSLFLTEHVRVRT